jgi:tRNA A-37 threonylcarbamoyl transferase component Bud32
MTFAQPFRDYEILDRVGAGAMGTVFKARQKKLGRIVALKVLKPSLARDSRYVDRLRREARLVASLNHPHIVTGYDLGEEGGYHFFVMEFVEGKSLRQLLAERGRFAEAEVLAIGREVGEALDHAYRSGVIHRDVKPGNILIDGLGHAKLTDLGLAKGPADLTLTRDGATVGTPQYISPEQARNPQDVDVRSDLYSLGATLYHMATGVPPFRGATMAELLTKVLHEVPEAPDAANPEVSPGLSLVLRKLLAKDLRVRYQTPRELLDDLERVAQSLPPAVDASRLAVPGGARPARPWLLAGGSLLAAALAVAGVWVANTWRPAPSAAGGHDDPFLLALDRQLAALASPGARLQQLRLLQADTAAEHLAALAGRERLELAALRAAVSSAVNHLLGEGWAELVSFARDPLEWPDRPRLERERVAPALHRHTGLWPDQLAAFAPLPRLDVLGAALDQELADRDTALVRNFERFLASALPNLIDERVRAGDFSGAERLWADALPLFANGVRTPRPERLARPLLQRLEQRLQPELLHGRALLDTAERAAAAGLQQQAEAVLQELRAALASGTNLEVVDGALSRLRSNLREVWPGPGRFRSGAGHDPWPGLEASLGEFEATLALAGARAAARRLEQRLDLAWRAAVEGSPALGLAVLGPVPERGEAEATARHRRALAAAAAVHEALLAAIARTPVPVPALPRSGGFAVELRVDSLGGVPQLVKLVPGQAAESTALVAYRLSDLFAALQRSGGEPLAKLPRDEAALGTVVAALLADDLEQVAARLGNGGDGWLQDAVWPRVLRARTGHEAPVVDRRADFQRLQATLAAARAGGSVTELDSAVRTCALRVPAEQQSDTERLLLRAARAFTELYRRQRELAEALAKAAPAGAVTAVEIDGESLRSQVVVDSAALLRSARDGWLLGKNGLEFTGGERAWADVVQQALPCTSGIDANAPKVQVQIDLAVPSEQVGRRFYVFEWRGVGFVVVVGNQGAVLAAFVDGDVRREDNVQKAFARAMAQTLQPKAALALPGAVHRLAVEIGAPFGPKRARVKVEWEGVVVLDEARPLEANRPAELWVLPRQELAVVQVVVRAFGQ